MYIFGGIEKQYSDYDKSAIVLQPIPYDGTSTWGKGADSALDAFIDATENMELYDIETNSEVYKKGISILDPILEKTTPEKVYEAVYVKAQELLKTNKFLTFLGGEHSVSIGIIKAYYQKYSNLTVVQLDAHADLRSSYLGSKYNHACAVHDASKNTNLIQVGIRSMDSCEIEFMNYDNCYFAHDIWDNSNWVNDSINKMTDEVYITIDLDVFDPSIMPSTGTPEPGGMSWYAVVNYLHEIAKLKTIVGFDIVEHAPISGLKAPDFLVAKLYYKLLSYKFKYNG